MTLRLVASDGELLAEPPPAPATLPTLEEAAADLARLVVQLPASLLAQQPTTLLAFGAVLYLMLRSRR